jgi:endonuclease/exonuclease/phosphatase family metal-dependent hydrolase
VPTFGRGIDEELILTRYPLLDFEVVPLYSPLAPFFFRHVLFARIDHPVEPIDVYTVHLAAGDDFGDVLCKDVASLPLPAPPPPCPAVCETFDTVRECQARQMAHFIEARHDIQGTGIITGDFNAPPFSNVYNEFADRGWIDSHLKAQNAECNPSTGINCTAGREDQNLNDLESTDLNQNVRIDYIFVIAPHREVARCQARFDGPTDGDRDGTGTGLFASEPNPFATACGEAPLPICWPSDHSGNQLDLNCEGDKRSHGFMSFNR